MGEPVSSWKASRYGFAAFFAISLVIAYTGLRVVLFLKFRPAGAVPVAEMVKMFLLGLPRDLLVGLLVTLPLLIWFLVLPESSFRARWHRRLLTGGLVLFWLVQVFLLFAEYFFFEEFKSRFNTVAVDYLLYPHEVFVNIWESYPVAVVALAEAARNFSVSLITNFVFGK